MPVLADDDVVVHRDTQRGCDVDDRFRHLDVGLRRGRIAGGMVVHQDSALPIYLYSLHFSASLRE